MSKFVIIFRWSRRQILLAYVLPNSLQIFVYVDSKWNVQQGLTKIVIFLIEQNGQLDRCFETLVVVVWLKFGDEGWEIYFL